MSARPAPGRDHPTDRLPAYLLHDLPAVEMREIELHLRTCRSCADELAQLQETFVAAVEGLPAAEPPADLWERIEARTASRPRSTVSRLRRTAPGPSRPARPAAGVGRALRAGLAASMVIAAVLGGWGVRQRQDLLAARSRLAAGEATLAALARDQARLATWLARDAVTVRRLPPADGAPDQAPASGSVLFLPEGQALVVMRDAPGEGRDFQAWGIRGDAVTSLGAFGGRTVEVAYDDFEAVAVSLEPDGGSETPTEVLGAVPTS